MKKILTLIAICLMIQIASASSVSDYRVFGTSFDGESCKAVVSSFHWSNGEVKMLKDSFIAIGNGSVCEELETRMDSFNKSFTSNDGLRHNKNNSVVGIVLGIAIEENAGVKIMTKVTRESGME